MDKTTSLLEAIDIFLDTRFSSAARERTRKTYRVILMVFYRDIFGETNPPTGELTEDHVTLFLDSRKLSDNSRKLYAAAVASLYRFLDKENALEGVSISRLRERIKDRTEGSSTKVLYPISEVERLIEYAASLTQTLPEGEMERLRLYRDRALILFLADTGLRIREACLLKRGDLDFDNLRVLVSVAKRNETDLLPVSTRAMRAVKDYLAARGALDGASGKPLRTLPVFTRHDPTARKNILPMGTATGRAILEKRVTAALGKEMAGEITPHTLRHRFVTRILKATGNLKTAQELARHKTIGSTQRYAHLADEDREKAYYETFEKDNQ